jgi:hypothetical protein
VIRDPRAPVRAHRPGFVESPRAQLAAHGRAFGRDLDLHPGWLGRAYRNVKLPAANATSAAIATQ